VIGLYCELYAQHLSMIHMCIYMLPINYTPFHSLYMLVEGAMACVDDAGADRAMAELLVVKIQRPLV
jgi:hypothetical protein